MSSVAPPTAFGPGDKKRPYLVFCAFPAPGHVFPTLRIAKEMIARGFEIAFLSADTFRAKVEAIGAEFVAIPGFAHVFGDAEKMAERLRAPPGMMRLLWAMRNFFMDSMPAQAEALKGFLERVREADPEREVIIINETGYMGTLPFLNGAPLPKGYSAFPKVLSVSTIPLFTRSIDTAPFGPGLPPDSTPSGRLRNKMLYELMDKFIFAENTAYQTKIMESLGATWDSTGINFWDLYNDSYETAIFLSSASMEYPRSDLRPCFKFTGMLPKEPPPADLQYPNWWSNLTGEGGKKVVVVTQGTTATMYEDLIIPAIRALGERDDLLVVAVLGVRGATLPAEVEIPANTRVIDYLPYDAILPLASVFVFNGGYGGFLHSVTHGVPMVIAGRSEDKPEVAARGEFSRVAVDLKTGTPSSEQVLDGVRKVLSEPSYKERVMEIRKENEGMDAFGKIEELIWEFVPAPSKI